MTSHMAVGRLAVGLLPPATLETLRASLLAEVGNLSREIEDLRATVEQLTGQSDSDSLLERELAERGTLRCLVALADVHGALHRMDAGSYGMCESCGEVIDAARLEAIPYARHCVTCPAPVFDPLG